MKSRAATTLILAGIMALLLGGAYVFALFYIMNKEATAVADLAQLDRITIEKDSLASVLNLVKETESARLELASYFTRDEYVVETLRLIENTARSSGLSVSIKSANVGGLDTPVREVRAQGKLGGPVDVSGLIENLTVTLEVEGSPEGMIRMLDAIEELPLHTTLGQTLFERSEGNSWHGSIVLSIRKIKS